MAQTDDRIERVRDSLGSMAEILERHGYDSSPRRLMCPNAQHQDRKPGTVKVFRGRHGNERIYCHSCGFSEDVIGLARALGERVDLSKPGFQVRPKPKAISTKTRLKNLLKDDTLIAFDWMAAKRLASLCRIDARKEIVKNVDYLSGRGSVSRISSLSDSLREYAVETYGLPFDLALGRAIRELERV